MTNHKKLSLVLIYGNWYIESTFDGWELWQLGKSPEIIKFLRVKIEDEDITQYLNWEMIMPIFGKCRTKLDEEIHAQKYQIIEEISKGNYIQHPLMKLHAALTTELLMINFTPMDVFHWCVNFIVWDNSDRFKPETT